MFVKCFIWPCVVEHPGSESQGKDSCPDRVNSKQKEGEETMEAKP